MIAEVTGEQLRFLWCRAGGDVLKEPLQVLGPARTRSEARRRNCALAQWWDGVQDAALYAAVRAAVRPLAWAELTATGDGGVPVRGLLAAGEGLSTLVLQDAIREADRPPWPGTPRRPLDAWSADTGGACRIRTGTAGRLAETLVRAAPPFTAAGGPPVRAGAEDAGPGTAGAQNPGGGFRAGGVTTTAGERIRRLAGAERAGEGEVVVSVPDGPSGTRRRARLAWVVVGGAGGYGGYLFDGDGVRDARSGGMVRARPAGREEVARAVCQRVASVMT